MDMMVVLGVNARMESRWCNNRGADLRVVERSKEAILIIRVQSGFKYTL